MIKVVLMLLFWAMAVYGGVESVRSMRRLRAERKYKDALFAWVEPSRSSLKYESLAWVGLAIHWTTVIVMGLVEFLVLALRYSPRGPFFFSFVFLVLISGAVAFVSLAWGSVLFHPAAGLLGGRRHYAVSTDGILWAGNFLPWSAFRSFEFDREHRFIRLWSSSFQGAVVFILFPPEELLPKLMELLQSHVPDETRAPPPGFLQQCVFPLLMALCCVPLLLAAYSIVQLPAEIFLIVNGILVYLLILLGGPGLMRSLFGREIQPAALEP